MDANSLRRLNWLWKYRHRHDTDVDLQQQITIIQSQLEQAGSVASQQTGAYVHLLAEGQEIAEGGSAIVWSSTHSLWAPHEFSPSLPVAPIGIPKTGYYDIDVMCGWDTVESGGSVWVVVHRENDQTIWPPAGTTGLWTADTGQHFEATAPGIPLLVGDQISVFVSSAEGVADLAYAVCVVHMEDRTELVPAPPVPPPPPAAQNVFVFLDSGTFDWEAAGSPAELADVWVIAGGGAGAKSAGSSGQKAGGGGAGGVLHLEDYAISGDVSVVVGAGGAAATGASESLILGSNGANSSFDGQTATGGGRGGVGAGSQNGNAGGCGGGGGAAGSTFGGGGSGSQGGDGAAGTTGDAGVRRGGGGGGAGGNGTTGSDGIGGDGGAGIDLSSVVGTEYGDDGWFAGGGAGNARDGNGTGGQGGGGDGGQDGLPNTGGGGGAAHARGGAGGKGIVIVKVADI